MEQQEDDADQQEVYSRCTHFVAIPIDNVTFLHRVATVQEAIIEAEPGLRPGLIDRRGLHLTIAAVSIEPQHLPAVRSSFEGVDDTHTHAQNLCMLEDILKRSLSRLETRPLLHLTSCLILAPGLRQERCKPC